jgi:hypothetical protein
MPVSRGAQREVTLSYNKLISCPPVITEWKSLTRLVRGCT